MIDISKRYQTRDGRPVRIYATDGGTLFPVHGAFWIRDSQYWQITQWTADGRYDHNNEYKRDLIEVPADNNEYKRDLIEVQVKKTFEAGKMYRTKGGSIAQIYATDCNDDCPIHGAILKPDEGWKILGWYADGRCYDDGEDGWDLVEAEN
jgi:hypothetical protein